VVEGGFEERSGGGVSECAADDLIFHPAGEVHSDRFAVGGATCFNLEVGPVLIERVGEIGGLNAEPRKFRSGPVNWLCRRLRRESRCGDTASQLAIEGLLLELLAEIARAGTATEKPMPDWLLRVRDLLHDRFAESLTLSEIARVAEVHPVYLARSFRRHLRTTVGDYVRSLRIQAACRQLAQDGTSLSEIAAAAGFADQSHFTRALKCATGLTPGEYRRSRRARSPLRSRG
jgi:AraC family transcriptional regulator